MPTILPTILDALPHAHLPSGAAVPDSPRMREVYRYLDAQALRIGAAYAGFGVDYRSRARDFTALGLPWLAASNRALAEALDNDVRLAALPTLYGQAGRLGVSTTEINWYAALLRAQLRSESEAGIEPARPVTLLAAAE